MKTLLLLFVLLGALLQTLDSATVTLTYGTIDDFDDDPNNREWLPVSVALQGCEEFDPPGDCGYAGGKTPITTYADKRTSDIALAFSVNNLPTDGSMRNPRIKMRVQNLIEAAENDCFGFFFDDQIDGSVCYPQYSQFLKDADGTLDGGDTRKVTVEWSLGDKKLDDKSMTIAQKISETGGFNFYITDDTSLDYIQFIYEADLEADLVSFTCNPYSVEGSVILDQNVYTDGDNKIVDGIDSNSFPYEGSQLIKTSTKDKDSTEATFKVKIESETRFWVFAHKNADLQWLSDGHWEHLTLSTSGNNDVHVETEDGEFKVYTKVYSGPRWVIFGPPAGGRSMFFVSFARASTLVPVPSNPAAKCDCSSTGDPHYTTWDNQRFDFYEPGAYHLVKARDCTFDVQTLTFKYGNTVTVNGVVGVRYLDNVITLARNEGPEKKLWTGSPTLRVNGVDTHLVDGASTAVGGLKVERKNANEHTISIEAVGLSVRSNSAGNWFHVYASLSDPNYQRTVDGLCGNCDGNGLNDFKYPNCAEAITSPASKLSSTAAYAWGVAWKATLSEDFVSVDNLAGLVTGTTSKTACELNPIQQECPDLVYPDPPVNEDDLEHTPPVDPKPPASFLKCEGDTPINTPEVDPPTPDPPTTEDPPLCTDRVDYQDIVDKCIECATTTKYPTDDCILDICLGEEEIDDYECPGENDCVPATIVESTTTEDSEYEWASLGDGTIEGSSNAEGCQTVKYSLPVGWELAPAEKGAVEQISSHKWDTRCMTTKEGSTYPTLIAAELTGACPLSGNLVKTTDGCYITNKCNTRILIRKAKETKCGNGVPEEGEECDDGNNVSGDGCSATCDMEFSFFCIPENTPSKCTPVKNIEEEKHECDIDMEGCEGCVVTEANKDYEICCTCSQPCC